MIEIDSFTYFLVLLTIAASSYVLMENKIKKSISFFIMITLIVGIVDMKIVEVGETLMGLNFLVYIIPIFILLVYLYELVVNELRD